MQMILFLVAVAGAGEIKSTAERENEFKFRCQVRFKKELTEQQAIAKCAGYLNSLKQSNNGIVPFYVDEVATYPKLRIGMSKQQILAVFGRPTSVSDTGGAFYYEEKPFCAEIWKGAPKNCSIHFDDWLPGYPGATYWVHFKYEYTDNLK